MSDIINNDYELNQLANDYAQMIIDEEREAHPEDFKDYLETYGDEKACEFAENSEHVIYTYKAHAICQNCNISGAETDFEEINDGSFMSYDLLATQLAYLELKGRTIHALYALIADL